MTPHATAMLHQPKVPSTGERQAIEVQIKWKEVKAQKQVLLDILSETTGHSTEKLERVSFYKDDLSQLVQRSLTLNRIFRDLCT